MARYEVTARARVGRRLTGSEHIDLAVRALTLQTGMQLTRVVDLDDGEVAIVLQRRQRSSKPDGVQWLTHRTLAEIGVEAASVRRIDVHRMTRRRGRALVRSWAGPGEGSGSAGVREPRRPSPAPPHLRAAADLPDSPQP